MRGFGKRLFTGASVVDKVAGCRERRYCSYMRAGDLEEAAAAADALEAALDRGEALPIAFTVGERHEPKAQQSSVPSRVISACTAY